LEIKALGVPVITPVNVLNFNPETKSGEIENSVGLPETSGTMDAIVDPV
jgi:hypothetical protein